MVVYGFDRPTVSGGDHASDESDLRVGFGGALAPLAANAGGGKPRNDCPPGFNLGSQSVQGYLQLPRTQAAVGADLISEAEVMAALISIDRNGNGNVCVDLSLGFEISSKPYVEYLYNVVDDNASVPS
jgi:hypothetical protein